MFSYSSLGRTARNIYEKNKKFRPLQARTQLSEQHCRMGKRIYKTHLFLYDTLGSATVEASLVIPFFIIAMVVIISICNCIRTKNIIYEGFQETAQYLAEYEYLYQMVESGLEIDLDHTLTGTAVDAATAYVKLRDYIDDEALIEKYVSNGIGGIVITKAEYNAEDAFVTLEIAYQLVVDVPFIGQVNWWIEEGIRQKAYVGYQLEDTGEEAEQYVYIAENESVYHLSRSCYHINLSIRQASKSEIENNISGFTPCEICAKYGSSTGSYYITETGNRYHTSLSCSGLKRTVYRVKLDEAGDLPACSDCGK